jgi:prefoldin subunit 5
MKIIRCLLAASVMLLGSSSVWAEPHFEISYKALWPGVTAPRHATLSSNIPSNHDFYIENFRSGDKWGVVSEFQTESKGGSDFGTADLFQVGFRSGSALLSAGQGFEVSRRLSEPASVNDPIFIDINDISLLRHFLGVTFSPSTVRVRRSISIEANVYGQGDRVLFSAGSYNVYTNATTNQHLLSIALEVEYQDGFAREEHEQIAELSSENLALQDSITELSEYIAQNEALIVQLTEEVESLKSQLAGGGNSNAQPADGDYTFDTPAKIKKRIKELNREIKTLRRLLAKLKA